MNQIYLDLLDRSIDAFGLTRWEAELNAGVSRSAVVLAIESSQEYALTTVNSLSESLVGQRASVAMDGQALALQEKGKESPIALEGVVLKSPEFYTIRGGGQPSHLVSALDELVAGGTIPASLLAAYTRLAVGAGRTPVVDAVLESGAGLTAWVNAAIVRDLGRPASPAELGRDVSMLEAGTSSSSLLAMILSD